jgi:hypothetical protein
MAISHFYILIAFAVCTTQLASAGIVPEAQHVTARAPSYTVSEVHEVVRSMLIKIIKKPLIVCSRILITSIRNMENMLEMTS